jgi:hypothetical protein
MATALVAGTNVTITPDDTNDTITISAAGGSGGGGSTTWGSITGTLASQTDLNTALSNKANTTHSHTISDTTGLQAALDSKAATSHTHTASNVTDLNEAVEDIIGTKVVAGTNVTVSYNDSTGETTVSAAGGSGGAATLNDLTDVTVASPAAGQFLGYNSGTSDWRNLSLTGSAALPTSGGVETVSTNGAATGSVTLNLANGNVFNVTLTGNTTFTFSGATAGKACSFGVYMHQDSTGGRTVTWPTSVKWPGGSAPTVSSDASATDIFVFESLDGGTTWYGSLVGVNFS